MWEWVGGAFGQGGWEGHRWEGCLGEVDGRDMQERWTKEVGELSV